MDERLLVVDDDARVAAGFRRGLNDAGFMADAVGTRGEAETAIHKGGYAAYVVDLQLGDGTGLDLLELIERTQPDAVSVLVTSHPSATALLSAQRYGARVATKPITAGELAQLLRIPKETRRKPERPSSVISALGLSPQEARLLHLWVMDGLGRSEIAAIMGLGAGTVRTLEARVMRKAKVKRKRQLVRVLWQLAKGDGEAPKRER